MTARATAVPVEVVGANGPHQANIFISQGMMSSQPGPVRRCLEITTPAYIIRIPEMELAQVWDEIARLFGFNEHSLPPGLTP